MKTIENAVVEDIDVTGAYLVSWGERRATSDCMWLTGITRPASDVSVGDKGRLVYKIGPSFGLWFFEKDKASG